MLLDLTDDKSKTTLVLVMAWRRQATSHYLSQCWPRSLSPYGVTRPQRVNIIVGGWPFSTMASDWSSAKPSICALTWSNATLHSLCSQNIDQIYRCHMIIGICTIWPGPTFIKPDQLDPWIKDQIKITLLPTISHLLLPNFVSCGRACPSHMTKNLVTVGAELWTTERFLVDPWSMDYADPVW